MITLDISSQVSLQPEILLDHPIPPSLAGVNPRNLLGREWWDETRHKTYSANDHVCMACGSTDFRLEAHERYLYDWSNHVLTFYEVVPICKWCHLYVHFLRLEQPQYQAQLSERARSLLERGYLLPKYKASLLELKTKKTYKYWTVSRIESFYAHQWILDITCLGLDPGDVLQADYIVT